MQRELPVQGMQKRERGGHTRPLGRGQPLSSVHYQRTACRNGGGGGTPQPEGEGGAPPEQARTPFVLAWYRRWGATPKA